MYKETPFDEHTGEKGRAYPETLSIAPLQEMPDAVISVPGSKSITNRALILAALADGVSTLRNALTSEDTEVMINALRQLGFTINTEDDGQTIRVQGLGGHIPAHKAELFLDNSGTSIRFLTALTALGSGTYSLDGVARMRERPQGDLLASLQALGVQAESVEGTGCPPLIVHSEGGLRGGATQLRAEASSQFLTALLMVAPYARYEVSIQIQGVLRPLYVEITQRMMAHWGVTINNEDNTRFDVSSGQRYVAQSEYIIEPDASSASYFFGAAAITGGCVYVSGLDRNALQGDVRFATEILSAMGCLVTSHQHGLQVQGPPPGELKGIERDMSAISDTSLTLAAIAPFANSPTTIRNIAHTRLQECDRIRAVCTELTKLGVRVEEFPDGFTIYPIDPTSIRAATIDTYNDHRIAMSFALIGLKVPGIVIQNPGCVAKTFPTYWQHLNLLRGT